MKKILLGLCLIIMTFVLVGCESSTSEENEKKPTGIVTNNASKKAEELKIDLEGFGYNYYAVDSKEDTIIFYLKEVEPTKKDGFVKAVKYLRTIATDNKVFDFYNQEKEWNEDEQLDTIAAIYTTLTLNGEKYNVTGNQILDDYNSTSYSTYQFRFEKENVE